CKNSTIVTALRHTALLFGKRTHALHVHRHPSRIHQSCSSHPEHPTDTSASPNHGVLHTVLHPTMGSFTQGQHSWGSLTQCSQVLHHSHPVAKGERGHPTRT